MIDDGNVASIMQRVENREWVEFPLQRVREVFAKIVILPVTEGVTRSAIKVLYNSPFHYLVCPNTANSFAVTLSVMDFLKRRGETMDVEALYAYPCSYIVVDHPYSHSKASNRAGNDGRSGNDLDLHGHERDAKRALNQSCCILSRSVYSIALSHGSSCSHDPPLFSMPFRVIPSPTRHRPHPHHRPFQLACLSSGIPSRVSRRSFG